MRVILWTIAAIVSSIANGKFLLWQNDPYFAYRLIGLSIERPILDHHPKAHIHKIRWISPWNPVDFMKSVKSSRFHLWNLAHFTREIWRISWNPWNPADFTLKSGRFHEIHEIWQISPRYHLWNPPKIIKASVSAKTLQFDECRVGDFTLEIWWISPWNLVDFTSEIWWISPRFHLWNPPKIIKASVSAKTLQFDECRVGAMTKDFTCEIQQSSPRFHLWNPPKIIKASVSAKTLQFDECRVGAMTKDFMKSARFHMKSTRFHEICWISKLWAFAWWSSIGLSFFKRPIRRVFAETSDFIRFGVDFTWNPPDFMQISWNLVDFMWNQKTSCKEL